MYFHNDDKAIMLSSNANKIIDNILGFYCKRYDEMDGSWFSFKFISSLNVSCGKKDVPRGSSFIRSPNW